MSKASLRRTVLEERRSLQEEPWLERSLAVIDRLIPLIEAWMEGRPSGIIHCYHPSAMQREVDTRPLINRLLSMGLTVALPKVDPNQTDMESHAIDHLGALTDPAASPFGIPEPSSHRLIYPHELDLVVVPSVVLDRSGNRIGYGKGYYDRYLMRTSARTVSPCFDFQLRDSIFEMMEPVDRRVDWIVTESQIIQTGANL